jgi:hypothetical protein
MAADVDAEAEPGWSRVGLHPKLKLSDLLDAEGLRHDDVAVTPVPGRRPSADEASPARVVGELDRSGGQGPGFLDGRGSTWRPVSTRADGMTPGQLATEEANAARTVAAYAMVRAMLARDTWTMSHILDRWATGPGTEGIDFATAMAGVGASLAIGMAAGNRDRALAEADEALAAALASPTWVNRSPPC